MTQVGRMMMVVGGGLFLFGVLLVGVGRFGLFGRLPGDFYVQRGNFVLYFPLATSLLLSLILSLLGYLFFRR